MSIYVEFDNSLVTGNNEIDSQHKEWIDKINKLLECCENGGGKIEAIKMLEYMADYTDFHFKAEEKLQEEAEYPALEEHKAQHAEFNKVVEELHEMLEELFLNQVVVFCVEADMFFGLENSNIDEGLMEPTYIELCLPFKSSYDF